MPVGEGYTHSDFVLFSNVANESIMDGPIISTTFDSFVSTCNDLFCQIIFCTDVYYIGRLTSVLTIVWWLNVPQCNLLDVMM